MTCTFPCLFYVFHAFLRCFSVLPCFHILLYKERSPCSMFHVPCSLRSLRYLFFPYVVLQGTQYMFHVPCSLFQVSSCVPCVTCLLEITSCITSEVALHCSLRPRWRAVGARPGPAPYWHSKLALLPPSQHLLDSKVDTCSLIPMTQKVLPIAAPAPRTDPPQAWTIAGPSTRYSFFPQATTSGSQLCSAELQPTPDRLPLGSTHPQCPWSHRAR